MKKYLVLSIITMSILASSSSVFAANNVSRMATTKGGQHVAQCAQEMERGISHCLQMSECPMMN